MVYPHAKAVRVLWICLLVSLGVFGAAFGQERVKPVQKLVVVDSRGRTVGQTLGGIGIHNFEAFGGADLSIRTIVVLQVDNWLVPVAVGRDRFYGGRVLWFESANCQGAPWLPPQQYPAEPPPLFPQVAIGPPGQTVYMAKPDAVTRSITINSILDNSLTCRNYVAQVESLPTQPLIDLLSVYTPPFSLRAARIPAQANASQRIIPERGRGTE